MRKKKRIITIWRPLCGRESQTGDDRKRGKGETWDTACTLKTEISEMVRNLDINDPVNTEIRCDVWKIVVISYQFTVSERLAY